MNVDLAFKLALQSPLLAVQLMELLTKRKVRSVRAVQTNFARKIVEMHADKVFDVTFEDDTQEMIHLEVQGKQSHRPMALRVFDYLTRIISQNGDLKTPIRSVVIYVGEGAGADDDGRWEFGAPSIGFFQYTVIKLWEYSADEWLELDIPALLPLIAQTRMDEPERQLQAAMERIYTLEDKEEVANLLFILATMLKQEGLKPMVQMFISKNEIMESPFVRDFYLKGLDEGREQGRDEGRKQGRNEGREQGRNEGREQGREDSIIEVLQSRFDLSLSHLTPIILKVTALPLEQLKPALHQAVTVESSDDFEAWLEHVEVDSD